MLAPELLTQDVATCAIEPEECLFVLGKATVRFADLFQMLLQLDSAFHGPAAIDRHH